MINWIEVQTDLIINWIDPIKTHPRETWGKSRVGKEDNRSRTCKISETAVHLVSLRHLEGGGNPNPLQ
jgi:hypothetical protein